MRLMALEKQMELFEEGGLMQEGGTVDEESGNDVPVGSLKKEVRDDIPAQLSEGEFVMPADVVRYHGLDKMMAMRDEAKMGLQRMEDMGQMGNADEATIPDGVPFSMDDLDIEDEPVEMQVGGFVQPPVVGMPTPPPMPSQFAGSQPQYTPYQVPTYGGYQPPQPQAVPTAPTGLPSFSDFVTPKYELYVNDAGNTISIPVDANGNPLIPVPAGYRKMDEQGGTTPITPDTGITPPTTTVSTGGDEPDGGGGPEPAGPKLDQFGREEDPRITQVKSTQPFKDIQKTVDPRGMFEKIKDDFLGAVGMSTTSEEYQKASNQLAVDVANYTSDPKEQSQLLTQIKDMVGASTRTALGMPLAPVISGEEYDRQRKAAAPTTMAVETAGVESAQTLVEEGATVSDVIKTKAKELRASMADLNLSENQKMDYLVTLAEGGVEKVTFGDPITGPTVDFSKFSPEAKTAAQQIINTIDTRGSDAQKQQLETSRGRLPKAEIKPTAVPRGFRTTETAKERMERTGEGMPVNQAITRGDTARDLISAAKTKNPSQYARDVRAGKYDSDFTAMDRAKEERNLQRNTGSNKVGTDIRGTYGDDVAKRVRDDQGTVTRVNTQTGQISYDSSHDWSKPTQTNANRVTSTKGEETASSRDDKIVCTAMNDAYGFGAFRQTVWLQQSKNLDPAYQKGYHRIFKPLIKVAYSNTKWYNKLLRSTLEGIARRRTADIWLQKKGKRHPIGAVERAILEPICYIVGKIK
jgi:hypothetical protein